MEACCECGNKTEFVCRCKNFSFCSAHGRIHLLFYADLVSNQTLDSER